MAYVNVAEWKTDQVTDWLKGLDNSILLYIQSFSNNRVNGQQLLGFGPDDLEHLGIYKIGHQEIILEGIEHLRSIHYELDRENLQLLAMRLSCLAHSLHNELCHSHTEMERLSTQILADIATIVTNVKPLIAWLDRPGFSGQLQYNTTRCEVLKLALRMATCGQRDRFAEAPVSDMKDASAQLGKLADTIIQEITDPLILQPASLDLATVKKRSSDDLGFYIVPSFRGIHQISDLKLNSAAHQCGKIEPGDEIIQINYQTVVGWDVKQVMHLFAESPTEVLMTLKKRPRHTKVYGQIYVKPYRLPSKKRSTHSHGFVPRPELLTRLQFRLPIQRLKLPDKSKIESPRESRDSMSSDEEVTTVQHKLVVPSKPVHRRATITGASPLSKRPPFDIHELWHDLKLEKESCGKQSSTSVVDFEERLSSVDKNSNTSSSTMEAEPNLETLTIKQKIEMFSREQKQEKPKVLPLKKNQRINNDLLSNGKTTNETNKPTDKLDKKEESEVIETIIPEKLKPDDQRESLQERPLSIDCSNECFSVQFKNKSSESIKEEMTCEETQYNEEHGKVVETINRHLLVHPFYDEQCFSKVDMNKPSNCNSLPSHTDTKRQNVYGLYTTSSLPHQNNTIHNREYISELSKTISRVNTEDIINNKEQISMSEPPSLTQKSIPPPVYSKREPISYDFVHPKHMSHMANQDKSYSTDSLNKFHDTRERLGQSQKKESVSSLYDQYENAREINKYNSLQDRHMKANYKDYYDSASTKSYSSSDYSEHSTASKSFDSSQERQTLPKAGIKLNPSPPIPPPRPSLSKPPNACYRAIMAARSLGKASPKTQRKKNPLLAKRRNISLKDFPTVECDGWLLQRCRKGSGTWVKRWCLIHSNTLYTFQSKQVTKAETMVCLPGFTVSPAEEVKSRPFAFKVYHTGTMFYFAADTNFELNVWLDAISTATLSPNPNTQEILYSESEGEEKTESVQHFIKKSQIPPTPAPRPQVQPAAMESKERKEHKDSKEPKEHKDSKMFGSLKKLGGRTNSSSSSGGSSLDRKCLRILGTGPMPVPTAQYRSYRRVHNTTPSPNTNSNNLNNNR
ncbi:connector enhancer of kinase suppressor of ras 2 isoform X2 [Cimex lectularius]|uniref:Connector enhancer of kinase suppressor of ras 2 n=1 Tax=Cimex lectularius TaxID=79782 RepID=A0A8I6S8G8_CIMLE|nr:connector enhancer of kinase suppressor of ras 2 isoform X2 [Cimex lectularius]